MGMGFLLPLGTWHGYLLASGALSQGDEFLEHQIVGAGRQGVDVGGCEVFGGDRGEDC